MKSSFDGSCAFDGSSCGNTENPSMASLGGCALEDVKWRRSHRRLNTIVCLPGDVKEVGVPSASSFYVSEKKKGARAFSFVDNGLRCRVRKLEILD